MADGDRALMASLLRREQDFLSQEERMVDDIRQKYKDAFNDDVSTTTSSSTRTLAMTVRCDG